MSCNCATLCYNRRDREEHAMSDTKTENLPAVRVSPALLAQIEDAAAQDERTVSDWVRLVIQRELVKRLTKPSLDNVSQCATIDA